MKTSTTEARRHGERSDGLRIARDSVTRDAASICHSERAQVEPSETSASRRIPTMPMPGNAASGSSHETHKAEKAADSYQGTSLRRAVMSKSIWALALVLFKSVIHNIRAVLREIFDESAYDRFLLRTKASRSVASYHDFMRERDAAILKKPRCC
jgi:hypothetical protein